MSIQIHTYTLLTMANACTQNVMHTYFTVAHIAKISISYFPIHRCSTVFPFICSHSHIENVCCRHSHMMLIWARLRYYICIFIVIALQANTFCLFESLGWSCICSKILPSILVASLQLVHYHNDLKAKHNVTNHFSLITSNQKLLQAESSFTTSKQNHSMCARVLF